MQTRILVMTLVGLGFFGLSACNDSSFQASSPGYAVTIAQEDDSSDYRLEEYSLAACDEPGTKKVLVCHVPPGNPKAAHTICISPNGATHGHGLDLTNPEATGGHGGDFLGDCAKPRTPAVSPSATPSPSPVPSETPESVESEG